MLYLLYMVITEIVFLPFSDFLVIKDRAGIQDCFITLLLLQDYSLWEMIIPASLKPNCEVVYQFFSFPFSVVSNSVFPIFPEPRAFKLFSVCPVFPRARIHSRSLSAMLCKPYFSSAPYSPVFICPILAGLCRLFSVRMANNLMCQRPSLLLFHGYLHFNVENPRCKNLTQKLGFPS